MTGIEDKMIQVQSSWKGAVHSLNNEQPYQPYHYGWRVLGVFAFRLL